MEDEAILALLEQGSEEALGRINEKYRRLGLQIALRILGSPEDAEECWNDSLLKLWRAAGAAIPDSLSAYLCKIVRNEALSRLRMRNTQKRGGEALVLALEELQGALPAGNDPQDAVDAIALKEAIDRFLWQLPPRDCEAFLQRYFYLRPVQEVAKSLGLHRVSLSANLRRTRKKLADYLRKEGLL